MLGGVFETGNTFLLSDSVILDGSNTMLLSNAAAGSPVFLASTGIATIEGFQLPAGSFAAKVSAGGTLRAFEVALEGGHVDVVGGSIAFH